jgi:molecular chaperone GrpE (heat shock protein)
MGVLLRREYFRWKEQVLQAYAENAQYRQDLEQGNATGDMEKIERAIEGLLATSERIRKGGQFSHVFSVLSDE